MVKQLNGAYALVFLMEQYPDQLIVVRRRSPVAIGLGEDEMFVASDSLVFSDKTENVIFLEDESFAIVKRNGVEIFDFDGEPLLVKPQKIEARFAQVGKQGFDHYMLKEIYEQKLAIGRTISFYKDLDGKEDLSKKNGKDQLWDQLGLTSEQVKSLRSINFVAAGTSWHSARIAQFFFESICKIPVHVSLGSEFRYMPLFPQENTVFIAISQSGETADTLEALRHIHSVGGMPTVALTNVAASSMVREAGGSLLMQAGPEISVCSTKAFSCQLASLYWLANRIALEKGLIDEEEMKVAEKDLLVVAEILESTIETYKKDIIDNLAKRYSKYDRFIFLGRHISYPFALEAALKLKEISYVFSQCYPSGELKHGPIALIDNSMPIVLFSSMDDIIYQKTVSNAQEVKARLGHLVVFAFEGQKELIDLADCAFVIPRVKPLLAPLAMTGLMQFFAYQITRELGHPIDKPRNLAKSVTVE